MKFDSYCDLLIRNRPENDSDNRYEECEDCYRYEICKNSFEAQNIGNCEEYGNEGDFI